MGKCRNPTLPDPTPPYDKLCPELGMQRGEAFVLFFGVEQFFDKSQNYRPLVPAQIHLYNTSTHKRMRLIARFQLVFQDLRNFHGRLSVRAALFLQHRSPNARLQTGRCDRRLVRSDWFRLPEPSKLHLLPRARKRNEHRRYGNLHFRTGLLFSRQTPQSVCLSCCPFYRDSTCCQQLFSVIFHLIRPSLSLPCLEFGHCLPSVLRIHAKA
ncbi:hypothetical protein QE320_gp083 [Pseudomonas phage EM]|uniref:Uncharacterized protein n=1 Tax=Pseudomonas phage EM TaxID=2936914 RepID=A0AAE9HJQ5_9CAUD|nr:hypothetical protein QE320_gp083 [Pseudomonas phage EM]UPW35971.1 hypothetical protein EM_186 [Pseudomonas phage EM]